LISYNEPELIQVEVGGTRYLTASGFRPSVIVAQAFGKGNHNLGLARAVRNARTYFSEDILGIVQREIKDAGEAVGLRENLESVGTNIDLGKGVVRSEIDTRGVLELSRDILNERGIDKSKLLVVAHPAHIYRVLETVRGLDMDGKPFIEDEVSWDKTDRQLWVRGSFLWVPREIAARVVYRKKGYVS
jgi:hypothetical protein